MWQTFVKGDGKISSIDAAFGHLVDNDDDDVLEAGEMSMLSAYHNDIYEASSPIKR